MLKTSYGLQANVRFVRFSSFPHIISPIPCASSLKPESASNYQRLVEIEGEIFYK
uniref:Uncharacterized protein n=1 Tax=Ascaris lumbricoides TaxID=6252 RepID=A0A0M3I9U5_ASCLU